MSHVIVIGAGPYGLAVAANLRQRNIRFRIFGQTMSMWKDHMPKGMRLKSDGFATNIGALPLTLAEFCRTTGRIYADLGHRTPIADMIAYGTAIRDQYVGTVEDKRVMTILPQSAGFVVHLNDGEEVVADRVIVATGLTGFERLPEVAGALPGQLTHASAHNDLSGFAGQHMVIIGAGQSAFETAALLHEQGAAQVTVLSRRPALWYDPHSEAVPHGWQRLRRPNFGLGPGWRTWLWSEAPRLFYYLPRPVRVAKAHTTFGPAGSGWLRDRVIGVPTISLLVGHAAYLSGRELAVRLADGTIRCIPADHIIAATGYKADLRKIDFLQSMLHSKAPQTMRWATAGIPVLNRRYETSIPGLHLIGYPSATTFGPSMRFIYGTNFVGSHLADALARWEPTQVQVRQLTKQAA